MIKKTIKYTDFNDVERSEDFYFHLSTAEIMEMELSVPGGLTGSITKIVKEQDGPALVKLLKTLILKAYGEKSPDGKRFIKSDEIRDSFEQTEAYSNLFIELLSDDKAASTFISGILPADAKAKLDQMDDNERKAEIAKLMG